ncbi:PAS domain S-box protein [Mesorhizobium sp. KR1-2]|uniref:PAS domain S-box protein n=1 Tax=Mesorhizobium sp. KR1-2 TaxID=3156609 RepID=UPI0032B51D6F
MPSASYSFIDVAILDDVRQRFAYGDALAILTTALDQVIWANGPGAAALGYAGIEAIIGEEPGLSLAARRQIMATSGFPHIGRDRSLLVRIASGTTSRAVNCLASAITLPDGEEALLLAFPADQGGARSERQLAERAIGGLDGHGQFAAFIGEDGHVEAASSGFEALGIAPQTLSELAAEVGMARDRLVKRMIRSAKGLLPAGMARLADEPARHLLIVVDEEHLATEATDEVEAEREEPAPMVEAEATEAPLAETESAPVATESEAEAVDVAAADTAESVSPPADMPAAESPAPAIEAPEAHTSAVAPSADDEAAVLASTGDEEPAPTAPEAAAPASTPRTDRGATPTRFVWRTDAEGRFSAISKEFADAVGAAAADVIGRRFRDVSNAFDLDPSGEIAGLLERRDTWSGRSVLWPVAGTGLKIPVDLAALPVYDRDRNFEGFRGFGVARSGEAVPDPEGLGLVLVPGPGGAPAESAHEQPEADPFLGEVPALAIEPKPDRRFTDKVIRLAEHRPGAAPDKGLSPVERSAFREIGERLKNGSGEKPTAASEAEEHGGAAGAPEAADHAEAPAPQAEQTADAGAPAGAETDAIPPASSEHEAAEAAGTDVPAEVPEEQQTAEHAGTAPDVEAEPAATDSSAESVSARQAPPLKQEGFLPSAFATDERKRLPADTAILEKLPVPVLIHSGDVLHYANEEFLSLTGYRSVEQLAAAGGLDALFAESYDDAAAEAPHHDLRLRTGDGLEFPIEALLRSVPWQGGKALMLVVRRTGEEEPQPAPEMQSPSEAELHARIAEMRTIIDTATDGVVLIDKDGSVRSISRPAEALFGLDSDEAAGKPFASLFAMESQRAVRDYLTGLAEHGVASVLNDGREVIGREAEGGFIPMFMTIGRLPNDSGYCAVVRDITQWKRAEEELTQARAIAERASSQKTDFLARVSHEIRTPLNAIIGFSELMIDEKFGPIANDRYRDYLRDINRSGNHVLDLVNDLLDISKIEAGQQEMSNEAVSLNDTLAETVAMMQPQANRERVIIRSSFASKLPDVVADLRSVRQIALNILSNAVRYTQAGGQVIVSTAYEASGDIVMRVRDTGIGMTQAEIEQALKPFKQINSLKRPRGDGTGLGLPLTKAMVEANRARFTINSTPGEGTLVEVTFPSTRVLAD